MEHGEEDPQYQFDDQLKSNEEINNKSKQDINDEQQFI